MRNVRSEKHQDYSSKNAVVRRASSDSDNDARLRRLLTVRLATSDSYARRGVPRRQARARRENLGRALARHSMCPPMFAQPLTAHQGRHMRSQAAQNYKPDTRTPNPCPSILNPRAVIKSETDEADAGVAPLPGLPPVGQPKGSQSPLNKITHRYWLTRAQLRNVPLNTPKREPSEIENLYRSTDSDSDDSKTIVHRIHNNMNSAITERNRQADPA